VRRKRFEAKLVAGEIAALFARATGPKRVEADAMLAKLGIDL
jgi:hypothetical protein